MLWLVCYHPQQVQVGGVPAQMKPVILLVNWNWASTPTSERVVAHRLSQVSLSQGRSTWYSSRRANFKKPMHRNSSIETRQLQKKLPIAGTQTWVVSYLFWKGEEAQICTAKMQHLCINIDTISTESKQGQALLSFSISVLLQKAVTNSHYKWCFTFANGDILLAPRQQEEESVILDSFYHTRKTS